MAPSVNDAEQKSHCKAVPRLEDFGMSRSRGFLPAEDPPLSLPAGFEAWDKIADELPHYLLAGIARERIAALPCLKVSSLSGCDLERAYSILSILANAYIWCEGEENAAKMLPRTIAVPLYEASERLGITPLLTNASVVLWNWRRFDTNGPMLLSNLACMRTTVAGLDEAWFYLVTVEIEAKGAKAVSAIEDAMLAVVDEDHTAVKAALSRLRDAIQDINVSMDRMFERCDPYIFYKKLRQFLSGWNNNPALPDGVIYEGVSDVPLKYNGGSAAQSSTIQAIDIALGVKHHPVRRPGETEEEFADHAGHDNSFIVTMRDYMPGNHRAYLQALEKSPSIAAYVRRESTPSEVVEVYNLAVAEMSSFRSRHINMVSTYIVAMAAKTQCGSALATRGTGGTGLMPFLKQTRTETEEKMVARCPFSQGRQ